jgi:hypothetical protein
MKETLTRIIKVDFGLKIDIEELISAIDEQDNGEVSRQPRLATTALILCATLRWLGTVPRVRRSSIQSSRCCFRARAMWQL